jgi:hypothetical protein
MIRVTLSITAANWPAARSAMEAARMTAQVPQERHWAELSASDWTATLSSHGEPEPSPRA